MMYRTSLTVVALTLALVGTAPRVARAAATVCSDYTNDSECGGATGDALCPADEDCIDLGAGCECQPRICCKCETAPGTIATDGALCDLPCTQTGIGLLACVGICALANSNTNDACNLKVIAGTTCSDGSCPTTGCCTFGGGSAQGAMTSGEVVTGPVCVETDSASCGLISGIFVQDGSCAGGLDGTCVSPTPTATPSDTPTATATSTITATATETLTATPTHTPQPNGASCTMPGECISMHCVDGVCCNTACDQPFDTCNAPPAPGTCVQVAPAPPVSRRGLFAGLALLTLIGAAALWHQRRAFGGTSA